MENLLIVSFLEYISFEGSVIMNEIAERMNSRWRTKQKFVSIILDLNNSFFFLAQQVFFIELFNSVIE